MKQGKRILSLLLALVLTLQTLPMAVLATETTAAEETIAETVSTQPAEMAMMVEIVPETTGSEETTSMTEPSVAETIPLETAEDTLSQEMIFASSGNCGDHLTWNLDDAGTLTISGTGDMWAFDFNSKKNTAPWGSTAANIKTIILKDGVTSIGNNAFPLCKNLTNITIPNTVASIGESAFGLCESLSSITIPDGVTSIGQYAFECCYKLESISLPSGVTRISEGTFSYCTSLSSITIPSSVTHISDYAFYKCSNLKEVYYGGTQNQWTALKQNIGSDNSYLNNAIIHTQDSQDNDSCGDNLTWNFDATSGRLTISGTGPMTDYENLDDIPWYDYSRHILYVTIEDGVTSIGKRAFMFCSNLSKVTIPQSVSSIGDFAFSYCNNLSTVNSLDNVTYIGSMAFDGCKLRSITIPNKCSIGDSAFSGCTNLYSVTIPGDVSYIGASVFVGCESLSKVTIQEGVTYLSDDMFGLCTGLSSISLPSTIKSIGRWSFSECRNLKTINLPANLKEIGELAFQSCEKITAITIPDSVESIGESAFSLCSGLSSITLPSNITAISGRTFYHCTSLKSIVIPDSVYSINNDAFSGCSAMTEITIPSTVTVIADNAFDKCNALSKVYFSGSENQWKTLKNSIGQNNDCLLTATIYCSDGVCGDNINWRIDNTTGTLILSGTGAMMNYAQPTDVPWYPYKDVITAVIIEPGITSISDNAFYYFRNLTSVSIPDSVGSIGFAAFAGCWKLTEVQIPEYVMIGDTAFSNCSALTNLVLGQGCTLGDAVFRGCTELTTVTIPAEAKGTGVKAFDGCTKLTNVTIENGLTEIPEGMFLDCENLKEIVLPESVSAIGKSAFQNCKYLGSITIPYNVASIQENAFYECYAVTDVYYGGTQGHWESLQKNISKGNDIIVNSAKVHYTDEDRLIILSDHPNLSISLKGNITLGAGVIYGAERMKDLSGLTFWVEDTSILALESKKIENDYLYLTFRGCKEGTTVVSFTDSITGFTSQTSVSVYPSNSYCYTLGSVPIVHSGKYDTNFYNFTGLYIDSYNYEVDEETGAAIVKFEAFNRSYTYAVVEIYDAEGEPVDVAIIDKMVDKNTSIKECLWDGPVGLIKDGKDIISMRPTYQSVNTSVEVTIPKGGYIKICTDPEDSAMVSLVNFADILFSIKDILGDVKGSIKDYKEIGPEFVRVLSKEAFRSQAYKELIDDEFKLSKNLTKNLSKDIFFSSKALGEFAETIAKNLDELNLTGIVIKTAGSFGYNITENSLLYFMDYIGIVMKGLFTIGKIQNTLCQCIDLRQAIGAGSICIQNQGGGSRQSEEVTVESEAGFDDDVALNVFRVEAHNHPKAIEAIQQYYPHLNNSIDKDGWSYLYDISLRKNGTETQPNGTVTVYIPVPKNMELFAAMNQVEIFREEDDGSLTEMDFEVINDCFVFTTNHFSIYAIYCYDVEPEVNVTRISGADRHDTAFKVANMLKSALNAEKFDTILIASGDDSADALAGSYLAAMKQAPILLSRNNSHPRNLAYIQENLSANGIVYILGGTGAVPQEMEDLLIQNGINYERVKGGDRFGTNIEILKKAGGIQGDEILVSTAYDFADSLSASATGKPILLVNSKRNTLNNAQKTYLAEITANGPKTFTIIGGTGAVSDELATALSAYGTVNRVKGSGREATSVKVAESYFQTPETVFLAYSKNFPDGLCGGPLAYVMDAPLLLVRAKYESPIAAYTEENGITNAHILGGTGAVPDEVARKAMNLPDDYVIEKLQ